MSRPAAAPSGIGLVYQITVGDPRNPDTDDVKHVDQFGNEAVARELVRTDSTLEYDDDAQGRCVGHERSSGRPVYITAQEASW